jgi:signal transduction histidine kinase/putative methionine-R-sulfoxide reductase with GAF domain
MHERMCGPTGPTPAPQGMVETTNRMSGTVEEHELRSVAQLRMLHALASRLNALDDIDAIGEAITTELKTLIDYHACRIYLLLEDGETLWPSTFKGDGEYESETHEELVSRVGEGITGRAAYLGQTYYAPDALKDPHGYQIEGTDEIDESLLAVPLKVGERVTGVIVLSHLGIDQFDEEDQRVLEVLASHASVAYENASLLQKEREAARTASALLGLSQALSGAGDVSSVLARVVAAVPSLIGATVVAAYRRDQATGGFALVDQHGAADERAAAASPIPAEVAGRLIASFEEPFVVSDELLARMSDEFRLVDGPTEVLVAPMSWEPDELGAIVCVAAGPGASFTDRDRDLARGIAQIASLALGSARRVSELERFHELAETLDAIFWEADPQTFAFTFLSRRAAQVLGGIAEGDALPERWGDHIVQEDRARMSAALRAAVDGPGDVLGLEYRTPGPGGDDLWVRDIVHVAADARGHQVVRGLIVDVTERVRAEQALRRSEQKYSEAFHREREATQRLRALDEMKNTFLQAVSHDMRTPLTSILGSAVTLEQAGLDLPREDVVDLLQRIASNARKLERLLSDLLDLDRLQRGIITPQRRRTDVGALVREAVREFEQLGGREVLFVSGPLPADVDPPKVERIVENLFSNASRHTPPDRRIWARVERTDDGILLTVEDEGDGVPDDLKDAIFEPFRQAPGPATVSPGVGVGLSLVARFAELHGGRAWVEDRPGGGASFKVLLAES